VILYSKLGNKISDAGHIKYSRGPQVPFPEPGLHRRSVESLKEKSIGYGFILRKLHDSSTI